MRFAVKNKKNTLLLMDATGKSEIIRVAESAVQLQRNMTLNARQTPFCYVVGKYRRILDNLFTCCDCFYVCWEDYTDSWIGIRH